MAVGMDDLASCVKLGPEKMNETTWETDLEKREVSRDS